MREKTSKKFIQWPKKNLIVMWVRFLVSSIAGMLGYGIVVLTIMLFVFLVFFIFFFQLFTH